MHGGAFHVNIDKLTTSELNERVYLFLSEYPSFQESLIYLGRTNARYTCNHGEVVAGGILKTLQQCSCAGSACSISRRKPRRYDGGFESFPVLSCWTVVIEQL